jgi:hypothetical protein
VLMADVLTRYDIWRSADLRGRYRDMRYSNTYSIGRRAVLRIVNSAYLDDVGECPSSIQASERDDMVTYKWVLPPEALQSASRAIRSLLDIASDVHCRALACTWAPTSSHLTRLLQNPAIDVEEQRPHTLLLHACSCAIVTLVYTTTC